MHHSRNLCSIQCFLDLPGGLTFGGVLPLRPYQAPAASRINSLRQHAHLLCLILISALLGFPEQPAEDFDGVNV